MAETQGPAEQPDNVVLTLRTQQIDAELVARRQRVEKLEKVL